MPTHWKGDQSLGQQNTKVDPKIPASWWVSPTQSPLLRWVMNTIPTITLQGRRDFAGTISPSLISWFLVKGQIILGGSDLIRWVFRKTGLFLKKQVRSFRGIGTEGEFLLPALKMERSITQGTRKASRIWEWIPADHQQRDRDLRSTKNGIQPTTWKSFRRKFFP